MAKATFILGLAGSGKTVIAEQLRDATGAQIFEGVEHHKSLPAIIQRLKDGKDCTVEEIAYCDPNRRATMMTNLRSQVPDVEIQWICLENDLESANWNVMHRKNKSDIEGHLAINRYWHRMYGYPDGAKITPIVRIDQK